MKKKEFVIGISVIIAALILFFGIEYLKGINLFHSANYYYVTYNNVEGLTQSAAVTINGFKVGNVREINYEYDHPGNVNVEISLDKQLRVPRGTKAVIVSSLLGTAEIALQMPTGAPDYHKVGDKLIGEVSPGLMDNISNSVMPAITTLVPRIDSLLIAVTTLASDPALARSIQRLDHVMANLETSTATLQRALAPTPGIVGNASVAMTDVKAVAANLNAISADLATVAATLKTMPLDSTMANVNAISSNLLTLSKQLNNPNSSLGLLMNDPSLYNNLNNASAHIDSILVGINRNPKRYIPSIKIF